MSEVSLNTIGGGFDYLTAGTQPSEKGVAAGKRNTLRLYDLAGDPKNIGRGEIIVNDFSQQGYNHPEGDFSSNSNGFAWSQFATYRAGELTPPPAVPTPTSITTSASDDGIHAVNAFGKKFVGIGNRANEALYGEGSLASPSLAAITFSPAGVICSLTQTVASGAERLAVGMIGAPVKLMSDASGTVASTMHNNTSSCWGIILSGINATTAGVPVMLMYCGTTIKTKATDADMTTDTVATVPPTTVNAGGFAIGAIKAGGRAQRAYWAIPIATNATGALSFTNATGDWDVSAMMEIKSTDMTGSDLLPFKSYYCPSGIIGAIPFRDGIAYHDGRHVVYWDGQQEYDLGIFRRRVQAASTTNSISGDERKRIRGLIDNGPELGVQWEWFDYNSVGHGYVFCEIYNFESGTWHNISPPQLKTSTAANSNTYLWGQGGAVVSQLTRNAHVLIVSGTASSSNAEAIYSQYMPRPGESLMWQNSKGSGSATAGLPTYATASMLGCRWTLDAYFPSAIRGENSIARLPKVITEVEFDGNLDYGGTNVWTFTVQVQGRGVDGTTTLTAYNQTFTQGRPSKDYKLRNPVPARANIQDVQLYLTATASGSVSTIGQLLPFTVRFAYSKDGKPITSLPEDVA